MTRAQFAVMIARVLEIVHGDTFSEYTLSDVEDKWYAKEIQLLVDLGIITGYSDGTFKGDGYLTRQQAATIIVRTLQFLGVEISNGADVQFDDLSTISAYAQNAVRFLAEKDVLVSGEDVSFNPHQKLTRVQMAKILVQGLRLSGKY